MLVISLHFWDFAYVDTMWDVDCSRVLYIQNHFHSYSFSILSFLLISPDEGSTLISRLVSLIIGVFFSFLFFSFFNFGWEEGCGDIFYDSCM